MRKKKPVDDNYSFTIEQLSENEDGSVNCVVHMSDFVKGKLIERGVLAMLMEYINQEKNK